VGVELAVLDPDNFHVPAGTVGEVCVRGANVTSGYCNNPAANEQAFAGGWFHTGDQGYIREADGYLQVGRGGFSAATVTRHICR
jgi:long-subunit acyl-CoA synthetase (AMP-forming)